MLFLSKSHIRQQETNDFYYSWAIYLVMLTVVDEYLAVYYLLINGIVGMGHIFILLNFCQFSFLLPLIFI